MGLAEVLRGGVALANSLTASLQSTVSHQAFTGNDGDGAPGYGSAVLRQALVEEGTRPHELPGGKIVVTKARITFLVPVAVDSRDKFTLPSGLTGPIVDMDHAMVDPLTNATYYKGVWIGDVMIRG